MDSSLLTEVALFLTAAVIAAPLAKKLQIGSVLGYLFAGILIGPFGLGFIYSIHDVTEILHIAELGVVLLLFLIGLELRPQRLWAMRHYVFGYGSAQVALSAAVITLAALGFGLAWQTALFIGLALSLSSTAFTLQVLEEKKELTAQHGRMSFSILLFQDMAAIPMIALVPIFAVASAGGSADVGMSWLGAAKGIGVIALVVVLGRFVLKHAYRLVAMTRVKEAMTASALLTVVGVVLLMQMAGLSPALGAFIAGALLSESEYRHEIEANIEPFEGLLLGLFFIAIGMSLNLTILQNQALAVLAIAAAILIVKSIILFAIGKYAELSNRSSRRLALATSQAGEFGLVLVAAAVGASVLTKGQSEFLSVVITVTMIATPLLLLIDDFFRARLPKDEQSYDSSLPEQDGHIVIAGFGRFAQITARMLAAKGIPFTALDSSAEQVDFVSKFGSKIYYGDPKRLDILRAAKTEHASALVLAVDNVESSLAIADLMRKYFPHVPVYARAKDRQHVHQLMDRGVEHIRRETFASALSLTREVFRGLGYSEHETRKMIDLFREQDRKQLYDDYGNHTDMAKLQANARSAAEELEALFARDVEEQRKADASS